MAMIGRAPERRVGRGAEQAQRVASPAGGRTSGKPATLRLPTRLAVCMHEAGHAVVQLADPLAPTIAGVMVDGLPEGILGYIDTPALWQPWMDDGNADPEVVEHRRKLAWKDVIFHLAGPVAELRWRRFTRVSIWCCWEQVAHRCLQGEAPDEGTDLGRVRRRLTATVDGDRMLAFRDAWIETEELVARWWQEIIWIGRTLDECGSLDDEELLEMWCGLKDSRTARIPDG